MTKSVDHSLQALGVDHIDLLLIHRPDYLIHPQEIAEGFTTLQKAGKVKAFGVSNFSYAQFDLLQSYIPLATNQIEVSLLHLDALDNGTLDQCIKAGIQPTAWSPLGGGALFSASEDPRIQRIQAAAQLLCEKYTTSLDQLLLAWLLKHPAGIVPVLGTSKISRVKSALEALHLQLTNEDWYHLLEASVGHEVA